MNNSKLGLAASIFTIDINTGVELGKKINTGTFFINRCDYFNPDLAWTGIIKFWAWQHPIRIRIYITHSTKAFSHQK